MKPIDFRNITWAEVREHLAGRRLAVHAALCQHGPCTTRELATRSEMDILVVRPRVTELVQLGFAELVPPVDPEKPGHEGVYQAIPEAEALMLFLTRSENARDPQLPLKLGA